MKTNSPRIQSQALINMAMKSYRGPSYVEPPKDTIKTNTYEKLTRAQSDQGVIALVHACNLSGGSLDDMDLYKLVRNYLWHPEAMAEINAIVKRYE